jgi:hydrogen peroxide-dependent heme synthase
MSALPPATLEGWYALHQMLRLDWGSLAAMEPDDRAREAAAVGAMLEGLSAPGEGWSGVFRLLAKDGDLLLLHFRPTLDEIADAELAVRRSWLGRMSRVTHDYLSVTEAGLYHATAETAREARPGSKEFAAALEERAAAEAASPHVRTRLYPVVPDGMRYLSFYPMNKRRVHPDNWYTLDVEQRNQLMREHGMSGRRFAGKIFQIITGSVGFDDWEWGVTLFARDPLEFKRIVTEMRYDEASARYGEFGRFFTGIRMDPGEAAALLAGDLAG